MIRKIVIERAIERGRHPRTRPVTWCVFIDHVEVASGVSFWEAVRTVNACVGMDGRDHTLDVDWKGPIKEIERYRFVTTYELPGGDENE